MNDASNLFLGWLNEETIKLNGGDFCTLLLGIIIFNNFVSELKISLSKDFSGAEIEQVVIEAMRLGFNENREFTTEDLIISIQKSVPLAKTKSKELKALKEWAESGNVARASKY